jgi:dinuclear metal center YbgI/SA1388 family protein
MDRQSIGFQVVLDFLARLAPLGLAESWDNVGLLAGDRRKSIQRVMTCLTITPRVVSEAIAARADVIVTHHPLPFKPLAKVTSDTITGQMLLDLLANQIAIYSAHTAMDSAAEGINQHIAERMEFEAIEPLVPLNKPEESKLAEMGLGSGRLAKIPSGENLAALASRLGRALHAGAVRAIGAPHLIPKRAAIACGSGGSFLDAARRRGCDLLITGEATFHTCLEAEASNIAVLLTGHYASERFAMEWLADRLADEFPALDVWSSRQESDPLWIAYAL